jgi:hypothetical protein
VIKLIFGLSHNIKSIILSTYVSGPFATSEKEKKKKKKKPSGPMLFRHMYNLHISKRISSCVFGEY